MTNALSSRPGGTIAGTPHPVARTLGAATTVRPSHAPAHGRARPTGLPASFVHAASGVLPRLLPVLLLLPALSSLPSHARAAEPAAPTGVTIYRCADSRGQLVALRDSPCLPGERQEVLQMQRPQDPPPRPAPPEPAAASPLPPPREVRVIAVQPPQPMYECTTPEGERYTSEDGQGHPRWVPFWTLGYGYPARPGPRPPDTGPGVHPPGPPPGVAPGGHRPGGPPHPGHAVVAPAGGAWIRDACVRLSQDEICTHLSDRRYEILRLYHAAMPSQRHALDREQRQIDARMGNDCPGY